MALGNMIGFEFPGSGGAYGIFETLPSFSAPYSAYLLGSSLSSTPTANIWANGAGGAGLLTGTPGSTGLVSAGAIFTGAITGTNLLTVSAFTGGAALAVGDEIGNAAGVKLGTIASLGTGIGGTGTYNLTAGATNVASSTLTSTQAYFELPTFGSTLAGTNNAMTLFAVVKSPVNQGILSDYLGANSAALLVNSLGQVQAYERDGASASASAVVSDPESALATKWALVVGTFTPTQAQAFHWRTADGLSASGAVTKASGAVGNTTLRPRFGRSYSTIQQGATCAMLGAYQQVLTSAQIISLGQNASLLMAAIGETL
jgi:hypothetical protein